MTRSLISAIGSLTAAVVLVLVVWLLVRPSVETSAIDEYARMLHATATYTNGLAENILHECFTTASVADAAIKARPREGENLLRTLLDQHPNLLAVKVHSPGTSDELFVHRREFLADSMMFSATGWFAWDNDTSIGGSIIPHGSDSLLIRTRTRFTLEQDEFFLTMIWNGQGFQRLFTTFPVDSAALVHLMGPTGIVWKNWAGDSVGLELRDRITERFNTFPLTLTIAFPTNAVTAPIRIALRDSIIMALIMILIPGIVGYWRRRKKGEGKE
jgi:hypothetical protein